MDISVIIPTYNRLWALPKAINSCKQSACSVEIIVIDDGSTDGTWEWLQSQQDITALRQENWGKPWAVNYAFGHTQGKYIKFLDSDDWLTPHSLDEQYNLAERENADLVVSGHEVYLDEEILRTQPWIECDDFIAQQLGECDSSHYSAFLFRKDFIKYIPHRTSFAAANFASRDDRCFMLEVALQHPKVAVMSTAALCHRHHQLGRLQFQNGLKSAATNLQHLLIYRNIINQLENTNRLTTRRKEAAMKILWPLAHWIAKTHINEATEVVHWIYRLCPDFQIPETGMLAISYNKLGFKRTQQLLKVRRFFKYGWN